MPGVPGGTEPGMSASIFVILVVAQGVNVALITRAAWRHRTMPQIWSAIFAWVVWTCVIIPLAVVDWMSP